MATPLPFVPGVVRMTIQGTVGGDVWANTLHFAYSGTTPTDGDCIDFATTLYAQWALGFLPCMPSTSGMQKTTCVDLSSDTSGAGEHVAVSPGTRVGSEIPGSACILVNKVMSRRYRGGHPRTYITGGVQSDLDSPSHWNAGTIVADVGAAYTGVQIALLGHTAGACTLGSEVNVSYFSKILNPVAPYRRTTPLVTPISAGIPRVKIATQRRRMSS